MPFFHRGQPDTSSWGIKEWRFARRWNACFIVAWTAFFAAGIVNSLRSDAHWLFIAFGATIGILGFITQAVSLIRLSLWLAKQKPIQKETT
ncbi:MAG: hypothetical protein JWP89_713 [Schlesneria sp.]|nr:hypothetical protein [Schlesneria sp.]